MKLIYFTALAVILCTQVESRTIKTDAPVVNTIDGPVQGISDMNADMYFGIPYAQAPVDGLRWEEPTRIEPWTNVLKAIKYKPACPQLDCSVRMPVATCPKETSEDCLYLNIFAPKKASTNSTNEKKAVMLFIHGGNFQFQGAGPLFDGRYLAKQNDVIVVTIQYRLGALGFLVTGLEPDQIQGNLGILDQKMAIRWVNKNIAAFGGDPNRITLFGQSAGAQSSMIHLLSEDMQDTFNNAIIQSAPASIPYRSFTDAMTIYFYFAEMLHCGPRDVLCLRKKSVSEILNAQMAVEKKVTSLRLLEFFEPWLPWQDGKVIKSNQLTLDYWQLPPNFKIKPFIMGTLTEEAYIFIYEGFKHSVQATEYVELIAAGFRTRALPVLNMYTPNFNIGADNRNLTSKLATDWIFGCSSRNFIEQTINFSGNDDSVSYYRYVFDYVMGFPGWGRFKYCYNHTCHGTDLPYTFDTGRENFTDTDKYIAKVHMKYWTNFAKTSNPNVEKIVSKSETPLKADGDLPVWPKYDMKTKLYLNFTKPAVNVMSNFKAASCAMFDKIGYYP